MDTKNNDIESTHIEHSQRMITEELSLKNITQILIQNWPLFTLIFVSLLTISSALYLHKIPYQSTASIIINDNKNSALQSFSAQFSNSMNSSKINEAKKANSSVQKNIEYLKTSDFYIQLAKNITEKKLALEMTISEKAGLEKFKAEILSNKFFENMNLDEQMLVAKKMDAMLKINLKSDYEIEITVNSLDKNLVYFLSKNSVSFIVSELRIRELSDLNKIKNFLIQKKIILDQSIHDLNKQIADFQSRPENLISLGAAKVGDYISDLMVRKNEVRMKISENNKIISALSFQPGQPKKDSQLYGNSGRIQALKSENDMLGAKILDLQNTIDRVSSQAKHIPATTMVYDELKQKSALEFENYKQVTENLSKIDASELALVNKFEILESPRYDQIKPLISLLTLVLLSLLISQVLGSIIIYIRSIWDTKYVTAQQTRNIVVIDGHSLDPRVIIENSKIKFRLNSSSFKADHENEKKIGFSFKSAKIVNGDTTHTDDE